MNIGLQICYVPQKKAKVIQKLILLAKSMIYVRKKHKNWNFSIFDLKMRQIRNLHRKIFQNFY